MGAANRQRLRTLTAKTRLTKEFRERLEHMHMNPVRRVFTEKPEQWDWSSYNNLSLEPFVAAACPIQIDYVHLPDGYRA